jgi:hypothetical protein
MSDFGADMRHHLDVAFYVRWLQRTHTTKTA